MSENFFSIVIPTYDFNGNGVKYLSQNIMILHNQTFKDFEVIISDDSENDKVKQLCDIWSEKLKIKYFKNDRKNFTSHSPNVNNGLKNAKGKWIKLLFQDDFLFDNESLQKQFSFIQKNPNVFWFFTKFYHTYDGKNLYNLYNPKWNQNVWSGNNTLGGPSGLTLKNYQVPEFDNELIWLMDCDFYQKMFLKHGEPLICDEITVVNRTSEDQLTSTIPDSIKINEHKIVNKKYIQ